MLTMDQVPQGWGRDPFGRHQERWMSQGEPTDLVRDRGIEARKHVADTPSQTYPTLYVGPLSRTLSRRAA